jgi:hypothetical protein
MFLSVTGAIVLNAPGPGPGGATVYPPTIAEDPTDVADGPGITDVIGEQAQVDQWKDALDNINNGTIGPGHVDG